LVVYKKKSSEKERIVDNLSEKKAQILTMLSPVIIIKKELVKTLKKSVKARQIKRRRGDGDEKNFSAQQQKTQERPRLPGPDAHP
jgi:hypothetical protein